MQVLLNIHACLCYLLQTHKHQQRNKIGRDPQSKEILKIRQDQEKEVKHLENRRWMAWKVTDLAKWRKPKCKCLQRRWVESIKLSHQHHSLPEGVGTVSTEMLEGLWYRNVVKTGRKLHDLLAACAASWLPPFQPSSRKGVWQWRWGAWFLGGGHQA